MHKDMFRITRDLHHFGTNYFRKECSLDVWATILMFYWLVVLCALFDFIIFVYYLLIYMIIYSITLPFKARTYIRKGVADGFWETYYSTMYRIIINDVDKT